MESVYPDTKIGEKCFHCGDDRGYSDIVFDNKVFCCQGCRMVYEILQQNDLCRYYDWENTPGVSPDHTRLEKFDYLENKDIQNELLTFSDGTIATITFNIPSIHCSSCIWLLEQLYKIDSGIISSRVEFLKKQITIRYKEKETTLKQIAVLLTSLGYEPELTFAGNESQTTSTYTRSLYAKIGVAAFCFGNAMLFSFPEYLGFDSDGALKNILSYLNLALGIPVFFYSASEYYRSAISGLKKKVINIDVPITIGAVVLFGRSCFEILGQTGPGYIDSLNGLIFFLLIGKVFQAKTYDRMNFERNYKSYFPIAVKYIKNGAVSSLPISEIQRGMKILIHNNEIIPADGFILSGEAQIDYSFVTGESRIVPKNVGDRVFAGGRQQGGILEIEIVKPVSQSYLTQLWNDISFHNNEAMLDSLSTVVSKYFTLVILLIACIAGIYWFPKDSGIAWDAITGILIVACPCAVAISTPFTLGSTLRIFGRNGLYLRNASVVEMMAKIQSVVFDKTGTLTIQGKMQIRFIGDSLSEIETSAIRSLADISLHPYSRSISKFFVDVPSVRMENVQEYVGKGIGGEYRGKHFVIGSSNYINAGTIDSVRESRVYIKIDDVIKGFFLIENEYRENLQPVVTELQKKYLVSVISGDNETDRDSLSAIFGRSPEMHFQKDPMEKRKYIKNVKSKGTRVLMFGDGLNDAGALNESNVGIAVTDDISAFTPSSDAILDGKHFDKVPIFLNFSKFSVQVIIASFVISFLYNIIGMSFAISGSLSPVIAAILMPISSITVVVFTTISVRMWAKHKGLL